MKVCRLLADAGRRTISPLLAWLKPVEAALQLVILVLDHSQHAAQPCPLGLVVPHPALELPLRVLEVRSHHNSDRRTEQVDRHDIRDMHPWPFVPQRNTLAA